MPILYIIHGPNLNLLGRREPEVYGRVTLQEIDERIMILAASLGAEARCYQSNHEGDLIDKIHEAAMAGAAGIIINPGGYTHTSVALRDAILGAGVPAIEVHLSNVYRREDFRQKSLTAGACHGVISGLGSAGYLAAARFFLEKRASAGSAMNFPSAS